MKFIELDMQDEAMLMALLPLYQTYEAEISEEEPDEFYPADSFDELFEHFKEYFFIQKCMAHGGLILGEFWHGFVWE